MKSVIPILLSAIVATSCSTAYKSGQTPDDVYYSAAPVRSGATGNDDYVQQRRNSEDQRSYKSNRNQYDDYNDAYAYDDDRYLRMKVRNRDRWAYLDYYYNDPFAFNYNGFGAYNRFYGANYWSPYTYWNSYSNWNYLYNPYYNPYGQVIVVNPKSPVYSRPRTTNLGAYNRSTAPTYTQPRRSNTVRFKTFDNRPFNQSNASNSGAEMRRSYGNSNSRNSTITPSRPATSSGSSSGSSGGSRPAPVRKF